MSTIHIVSHTHWDREWYQPFQLFRLRLVHLVDNLLVILAQNPDYLHFMLDGQTIVLEDYLQMRMERMAELSAHIQQNRVLIGPWYILPDEFLVSPEATIRNLLIGKKICEVFGQRMMIGYIPDPFGHISQMPQILQGFHIDTACLWRGVPEDKPTLLWWQSPDGSHVLLAHLYTSYGNGAHLPAADVEDTADQLQQAVDALAPHNPVSHTLIMRGSDHLEPRHELPAQIAALNQKWAGKAQVLHSTLPAYLAAATDEINQNHLELQIIHGELRDPRKAHMLPGVLSARMWIKQRNQAAETMLERWVEPFSTWAELALRADQAFTPLTAVESTPRIADPAPLIHQAWKLLITNHPHDSICGCSIDQTHFEMRSRFDQVDQISEELTVQSLQALAGCVDTTPPLSHPDAYAALTVFNAAPYAQSGSVEVSIDLPNPDQPIQLIDESGNPLICAFSQPERAFIEQNTYPVGELPGLLNDVSQSGYSNRRLVNARLSEKDGFQTVEAEFSSILTPNEESLLNAFQQIMQLIVTSAPDTRIQVVLRNTWAARATISIPEVPASGLRTFWVTPAPQTHTPENLSSQSVDTIENEFYRVIVNMEDDTLSVFDKLTQVNYPGLHAFADVADRGDEYNFCPLPADMPIQPRLLNANVVSSPTSATLTLIQSYDLPAALDPTREARSAEQVSTTFTSVVTLTRGVRRIEVHTEFDNCAKDHRLSVHFPTGMSVQTARMDGHFDVLERPLDLPAADATWMELPRPEVPQRTFTDVSAGGRGLMLANRGLPEVAVLKRTDGTAEIALTLLRCVGWLSRDDMWVRKGHAGPGIATPDAQEQVHYTFDYVLIPHDGDWQTASQEAHAFQTPLRALVSVPSAGTLPPSAQIVQASPAEFLLTAVKTAENEQGWIVRGVNLSNAPITVCLTPFRPFPAASLVYLDESFKKVLTPGSDGSVSFTLGVKSIASVMFGLHAGV